MIRLIGWICFLLFFFGVLYSVIFGTSQQVLADFLDLPSQSVTLVINLTGTICFFSGIMNVAKQTGLIDRFARFLSRPLGALIPDIRKNQVVRSDVTMNLASNFFGLGNAATPFGIRGSMGLVKESMTRSLATFLILNTCSVQLIPTTVCALRQANGAENPTDILPAVWLVQVFSCIFGILLVRVLFREEK
ncbi:MAG: ABC transporter permease [Clostridia bacterium]|nr:ABC transporter permease [Clostridia bacterium]